MEQIFLYHALASGVSGHITLPFQDLIEVRAEAPCRLPVVIRIPVRKASVIKRYFPSLPRARLPREVKPTSPITRSRRQPSRT